VPPDGFSLDLDSTVFQRSGNQEGAKRGYNPSRPGRNSHHPLIAFLTEALALMPAHWKLRTVRADSGFFENALLTFLEARSIPYIIVARLTQTVKRKAASLAIWTPIDENYAWARFTLQGWSAPREFFAIRERIRENKTPSDDGSSTWTATPFASS
jgi:hypothetical protein